VVCYEIIVVSFSLNSNNFDTILSLSKKSYLPFIFCGVAPGDFSKS
jgi:hypothetical protein